MGGVPRKNRGNPGDNLGQSPEDILRRALDIKGTPPEGWIRLMRATRGMSLRRLGQRIGIAGNSVHVAERREREGGISLYQLQRIAEALDCELRYSFVRKAGARTRGDAAERPASVRSLK